MRARLRLAALGLAVCCAWMGQAVADEQASSQEGQSCALDNAFSLPATTEPGGFVSIPVKINDKDAMLEVDTGSIYSSVTVDTVNERKLPHKPIPKGMFSFLAGVNVTDMALLNAFRIGPLSTLNYPLIIEPPRISEIDVDGLIGPDIFQNYDLELDFAGGKLNVFHWNGCDGKGAYWKDLDYDAVPILFDTEWHINVPLTIDGKPIRAVLDTGAQVSFISMTAAKKIFGIDEGAAALKSLGKLEFNGVPAETYSYPFATLSFGKTKVDRPNVLIVSDEVARGDRRLLLGVDMLRHMRLYIAYKRRTLYVADATAVIGPPPTLVPDAASAPKP